MASLATATFAPPRADAAQPTPASNRVQQTTTTNAVSSPGIPPGDPFAMRGTVDGDGFVSAGSAAIPTGIRVAGILVVANKKPVAALLIPGSQSLHFVTEGEIIQVDRVALAGNPAATGAQLYLLVKSITANQVEIAPRTRPQEVRIYR
jgi:hypothetical protein